ncbi:hypothetical protein HK096_008930, partial [Nowakowskiella sp. JEL0078]
LFVYGTTKKFSGITSTTKDMFMAVVMADSRATFIDTCALIVKFSASMSGLSVNQMRMIFHLMDFAKVACTHWFVFEITEGILKAT